MKKITLTIITSVFILTIAYGQSTELQVQLNSGQFSFSGKAAERVSFINYSNQSKTGYTNNPYGSKSGLSIGISGNIKKVTKHNFIFGADLGFEILRSKISIDRISGDTETYNASGQTFLNYSFLNLNPFVGYRVIIGKIPFDFTGGLDLGYCINAKENGKASTSDGTDYETSIDRKTIKNDIRPRLQIAVRYKKIGIYSGYSLGLTNYMSGYECGTNESYSRFLRFGLTYQLK